MKALWSLLVTVFAIGVIIVWVALLPASLLVACLVLLWCFIHDMLYGHAGDDF